MSKPRILIVDDDERISRLVKLILDKTEMYEVKTENVSPRALETALEFKPALILLDVDMPQMDGGEVSHSIRSNSLLQDTPIIFLTSLVTRSEAGEAPVLRGNDLFLSKPVHPLVLINTVESILKAGVVAG
jgi:CheY-like chemotaxis protein